VISKKPALDLIPGEIENALDAAAQSRQPVATMSDAAEKVPEGTNNRSANELTKQPVNEQFA
jgi:hypothetical protein